MVAKLEPLKPLVGGETLAHWHELARAGRVDELFESVMVGHYDPCYARSTLRNYGDRAGAMTLELESLGGERVSVAVRQIRSG
jgi:tRNA 2-selenouridine synthase